MRERKLEGARPSDSPTTLDTMPATGLRRGIDQVDHVVVQRTVEDAVQEVEPVESVESDPTAVVDQLLRRIDNEQRSLTSPTPTLSLPLSKPTQNSSSVRDQSKCEHGEPPN